MISILKKTVITLLAIVLLLFLVLLSSRFYLPAIISSLLKEQGFVVDSFISDIPGKSSWAIQKANLRSTLGSNLIGEDIVLNYRWSEILGGKLISVDIKNLSYTPNITVNNEGKNDSETATDTPLENLPLPSEWLENFPADTIRINNGEFLPQKISENGKTTDEMSIRFQAELNMDDTGLDLSGGVELNNTKFKVLGRINHDNTLHFEMSPSNPEHEIENSLTFDGSMDNKKFLGKGNGKLSLNFLQSMFPEDTNVSKLDGFVSTQVDLNLQLAKGELTSDSSLRLLGEIKHENFFEVFTINQHLKLTDNVNYPRVVLSAGNTLVIDKLKNPINYERLELILDSDITIQNAGEKISALTTDLTVDDIKTLLSEPARLRFKSSNLSASADSSSPNTSIDTTLIIQDSSLAINGSLAFDDTVVNIDTAIKINQLSPLLISIKPKSQIDILQSNTANSEGEEITIHLNNELTLSIVQDKVEIIETSEFSVQIAEQEVLLSASGNIQPLKLQLAVRNDDLIVEQTHLGEVMAEFNIEQNNDTIDSHLSINAFGTKIVGNATFNVETSSGKFTASIEDLLGTQQFLSQWCTEITSGSINTTGSFNLGSDLSLDAQIAINNFDINASEFQIDNLQYQGRWQYGDGLRSELGSITANQINPGILVENLDATLSYDDKLVTIPSLKATILQGELGGKDLQWAINKDSNAIRLTLSDVDLAELVAVAEYDMEISGKVKATLPIVVDSAGVQVVDGTIESSPPGGEIHIPIDATAVSGPQKEAFDALRNFHYTDLSGGISGFLALNPEGLLTSKLRLEGNNPDMGRPVVLNLSVEQNTYPLFQSLSIFSQVENFGQCKN